MVIVPLIVKLYIALFSIYKENVCLMADKFRPLIKAIENEFCKHRLFNRATSAIGKTTEKTQEKLTNVQNTIVEKCDTISKQINSYTTIIQDLNATRLQPASPLPRKFVKWWQWYQQLTGLDIVELSKEQVIAAQDKLFRCQEERRRLNREVTMYNERLKEIYAELVQTKRDDPRYVQLTITENKNLQEQAKVIAQLNLLENEEKDLFTLLATSMKEYHDNQTMNAQKYKYISILASALLAIVSLTGSMIYNNKRIMDVRYVIAQAQEKNEAILANEFSSLHNNFNARFSEVLKKLEQVNTIHNPGSLPVQQTSDVVSPNTWYRVYTSHVYKAIAYCTGILGLKRLFG